MPNRQQTALPPGHARTARGSILNFDELKMKARRPIQKTVDNRSTVARKNRPAPPMSVRGFAPTSGEADHTVQYVPEKVIATIPAVEEGESLADITAIRIDRPKFLKKRPKDAKEALNEVIKALDSGEPEKPLGDVPADWTKG